MNYLVWLVALSVLVAGLELFFAARDQRTLRKWLWSDFAHLLFNGHFLGLILYWIAFHRVLPLFDGFLAEQGWTDGVYRSAARDWPLAVQAVAALFGIDLLHWLVHNSLHRSSLLWKFHQVHHSVKDGEMDWIVSFRFSWFEPVIYKTAMHLPLMWFGFAPEALFFHAVFGTLIGHLNHANLTWDYGPFRYLLNSPRMHLLHHDWDAPRTGRNFGIIFSCWDWIFRTAHLPDEPPARIGFPGVEELPNDFFGQIIWPIPLLIPALRRTNAVATVAGMAVIGLLAAASMPPAVPPPVAARPSIEPEQPAGHPRVQPPKTP